MMKTHQVHGVWTIILEVEEGARDAELPSLCGSSTPCFRQRHGPKRLRYKLQSHKEHGTRPLPMGR